MLMCCSIQIWQNAPITILQSNVSLKTQQCCFLLSKNFYSMEYNCPAVSLCLAHVFYTGVGDFCPITTGNARIFRQLAAKLYIMY